MQLYDVVRWYFLKKSKCVKTKKMATGCLLTMASQLADVCLLMYVLHTGDTGDTCCSLVLLWVDTCAVDEPSQHFCCHVFGKDVCWIVFAGDLVQRYYASLDEVLDEHKFEFDVLCTF